MGPKYNQSYIGLRPDILKHVTGYDLYVLDVGCAAGANGHWLRKNGAAKYLFGVEVDQNMAKLAEENFDKIIVGDIESVDVASKIPRQLFDYILLGDVLEHLREPWTVLNSLCNSLKPDGKIIFSVPNIRHVDVFIHIFIKGYWPYNDRGIFDRSHIRMFTRKNVYDIAEYADLKILKLDRNFRYRDKVGSIFPVYGKIIKKIFPEFYTFQYIVVCEKNKINYNLGKI